MEWISVKGIKMKVEVEDNRIIKKFDEVKREEAEKALKETKGNNQ